MQTDVQITTSAIAEPQPAAVLSGETGAWVEFQGIVRAEEQSREIAALEYEAYAGMAEKEMRRILGALAEKHPVQFVRVIHRVGEIPVNQTAIYVGIAAKHRGEAFALLQEFMERLKQDVPIWKVRGIEPNQAA